MGDLLPFCYPLVLRRRFIAARIARSTRSAASGLQAGQDMAVEIDRNRHAGMAETFLRHFRVNAGGQQVGGVAVAQIVQSHSRQAALSKEDFERVRDAARLQWLAVRTHHDVMIVR